MSFSSCLFVAPIGRIIFSLRMLVHETPYVAALISMFSKSLPLCINMSSLAASTSSADSPYKWQTNFCTILKIASIFGLHPEISSNAVVYDGSLFQVVKHIFLPLPLKLDVVSYPVNA